ncbi:methanogenic corrinoid protein MtbC1 [Nocardioides aurantiacus]|uniref:Methanogenic corrinoid protein MtbC1 n=1 Tax=Nocardioides aurantiacus TaxID=86796 RepID=A0A3N2CUC7_9ACTN|nr:methanogenic corrinoid protein MtbC1 [Nocardioides aurantiacus]
MAGAVAEIRAVPRADLARDVAAGLGGTDVQLLELVGLHVDALTTALELGAPELLAEQVRWEDARLRGLGLDLGALDVRRAVVSALGPHLTPPATSRVRLLHGEVAHLVADPPAASTPDLPAGAAAYLRAALTLRRTPAVGVVEQALRRGASAAEITLGILQPAQVEVGRLWQAGLITIAQEHFISAVTQTCLALVSTPGDQVSGRVTSRLVASAVGSEGHDLGLRMLCELLQNEGWETEFLGAGVPGPDLVAFVATVRPQVVALSVTLPASLAPARETIALLRADAACRGVRVVLGGRAVDAKPDLARTLGADGWAAGPAEAIALCRDWAVPAAPPTDDDGSRATRRERALAELVRRYEFDERNVEGALDLLAAQMQLTADELIDRLAPPRG